MNMADLEREQHGGAVTARAKHYMTQTVAIFEKFFADPADKFHGLARPFYERALQAVNGALEVEVAIGGKPGGLHGERAKPERVWVRSYADLERLVKHKLAGIEQQLHRPPLRVDPYVDAEAPKEALTA
jgi:hypothetical protein